MSQIDSHLTAHFSRSLFSDAEGGKIMGKDASLIRSVQTMMQDAAEELSFTLDRGLDATLQARSEKGRDSSRRSRIEQAKKYCEMLAEEEGDSTNQKTKEATFDAFLMGEPDSERIIREALRHWEYPEEAWANLNAASERAKSKGLSSDILASLDEAFLLMEQRFGGAIRAGLTGALVSEKALNISARERGKEYREALFLQGTVLDLYDSISKSHPNDFSEAIDFYERAIALDMSQSDPSKSKVELEDFGANLGRLKLIRSADEICKKIQTPSLTHSDLLAKILTIGASPYPSAVEIKQLADTAGKSELEDRILFLQSLLTSLRTFPERVFDADSGRMKVIDATQAAVDDLIREEDALYA